MRVTEVNIPTISLTNKYPYLSRDEDGRLVLVYCNVAVGIERFDIWSGAALTGSMKSVFSINALPAGSRVTLTQE